MGFFEDPKKLRMACRSGEYDGPTSGHAYGYVQANMVILAKKDADEFREFCYLNPKPCPILEVLEEGDPEPKSCAPNADIRSDLSRYRVFRDGEATGDVTDISQIWSNDLVTFLLGCSFTAEEALTEAGLEPRHIRETGIVPMYKTTKPTKSAGNFSGPFVVSMRPYTPKDAQRASDITAKYSIAHGAPIQIGDPISIGIRDVGRPDFGEPVTIKDKEVPVFWACGVTPQVAIANAKPKLAITHVPGYMFVSDLKSEQAVPWQEQKKGT